MKYKRSRGKDTNKKHFLGIYFTKMATHVHKWGPAKKILNIVCGCSLWEVPPGDTYTWCTAVLPKQLFELFTLGCLGVKSYQ